MGSVYLGRTPGGRPAAIKVIGEQFQQHPEALARFRREVDTLRTVRSAYTAALIDCELSTPPYWLATEYVPGPTLSATIVKSGALPAAVCRDLLAALAEALTDIHIHGVCHRDIKPQNVILSATGPQLIDFGIARRPEQAGLTQVGKTVGTPGFAAPEMLTRNEVGPAADVFALGATIAFAATGRPPFGEGSVTTVSYRSIHGDIDLKGVEEELAALISACVVRDRRRRPSPDTIVARCRPETTLAENPAYQTTIGQRSDSVSVPAGSVPGVSVPGVSAPVVAVPAPTPVAPVPASVSGSAPVSASAPVSSSGTASASASVPALEPVTAAQAVPRTTQVMELSSWNALNGHAVAVVAVLGLVLVIILGITLT